jgi:hypothetical protein
VLCKDNDLEKEQTMSESEQKPNGTPSNDAQHPDLYFDGIFVTTTVFGANMTLSLSNPHPSNETEAKNIKQVATIRTSLEHAKIFAMLLRKQLKTYEINTGIQIRLPGGLYESLGLDENDW